MIFSSPFKGEAGRGMGFPAGPIPTPSGGLALQSQPVPAGQSDALPNPASTPLKGRG